MAERQSTRALLTETHRSLFLPRLQLADETEEQTEREKRERGVIMERSKEIERMTDKCRDREM